MNYEKCSNNVRSLLGEIVDSHYPELADAKVTIDLLFVFDDSEKVTVPPKAALKHHGWPALAVVSITKLKDRVRGCKDALIVIDGDRWESLTQAERRALLDHELCHLQLQIRGGELLKDSAGRPKLKIRPHDFEIGGFHTVINRYQESALELQALATAAEVHGQLTFNFERDQAA